MSWTNSQTDVVWAAIVVFMKGVHGDSKPRNKRTLYKDSKQQAESTHWVQTSITNITHIHISQKI